MLSLEKDGVVHEAEGLGFALVAGSIGPEDVGSRGDSPVRPLLRAAVVPAGRNVQRHCLLVPAVDISYAGMEEADNIAKQVNQKKKAIGCQQHREDLEASFFGIRISALCRLHILLISSFLLIPCCTTGKLTY